MAIPFTIGATKKKATISQGSLLSSPKKAATKKAASKSAPKKAAAKKPASKKPKAVITQGKLFKGGMASYAGRVLAKKTQGYRSAGSAAKAPTADQRKAGKILAVCKHYGSRTCNSPQGVVKALANSKSTWKPVGARGKRVTIRQK